MTQRPTTFPLTRPGPFRLFSTAELLTMPPPVWLIQPVMTAGGFTVLYGPPGVGKSFIALDMALSIAAGGFWQGCPVEQGDVLYVAAEGAPGTGKRVKAWHLTRGVTPAQAPVSWLTQPIGITSDGEDMEVLMDRIAHELNRPPVLTVIDTLARCFEGNENEQEDMGQFVKGVDMLRTGFSTAVLVVHHTRLDGERERGNTALRGAADTMLSVTKDAKWDITLECTKQKDAEEFDAMSLRLKPVPSTDSCVLAIKTAPTERQQGKAQEVLEFLREGPLTFSEWHSDTKLPKKTFCRYLVSLRENREIIKKKGKYHLVIDT